MVRLERCPFCGGKAAIRKRRWESSAPGAQPMDVVRVQCEICGMAADHWWPVKDAAQAIEVWNHRPGGWVDVNDHVPDSVRHVLVARKDKKGDWEIGIGYYAVDHFSPLRTCRNVRYWHELPRDPWEG